VFGVVPHEGRNLIHCFNGERKERDKGTKGGEEWKYEINISPLIFNEPLH
jgi:hypothetical protein